MTPQRSDSTRRSEAIAAAMLVTCSLVWGSNVVVGRALHDSIPPVALSFWRNAVALLVLLPFAAKRLGAALPSLRKHAGVVLTCGIVGTAFFNVVLYLGLHTTTAVNGGILMALSPIIIPPFAFVILRERIKPRELAGILVSLFGVLLMVTRGNVVALLELNSEVGDLLILVAAICWAIYSVVVKLRPTDVDPLTFLTGILVVAVVALVPAYVWEHARGQTTQVTVSTLLAIAYVGVFPTAVALWLFNLAVDRIGPIRAGLYVHLVPLFSTAMAVSLLGESLEWYQLLGAVPIAAGLYLTTTAKPLRE